MSCCSLAGLGDVPTAAMQDAVRQAVAAEGGGDINPKDKPHFEPSDPGWFGLLQTDNGRIDPSGYSPTCVASPAAKVNLFQTASGLALGTTGAGIGILGATHMIAASAIPVAGAVIAGVAAVIGIVETIMAHHAAAVKQEQQLGCAAISGWNNSLDVLEQAVANGQMQPGDAAAAMDSLYSKVEGFLAPSDSHSPYCSAVCELLIGMHAIALYKKSQFEAMPAIAGSGGDVFSQGLNVGGFQLSPMMLLIGGGILFFAFRR